MIDVNPIRELRCKTGLSQEAFGAALGIPKRSVQNWEGTVRRPPAYLVSLIAFRVEHDPSLRRNTALPENK